MEANDGPCFRIGHTVVPAWLRMFVFLLRLSWHNYLFGGIHGKLTEKDIVDGMIAGSLKERTVKETVDDGR